MENIISLAAEQTPVPQEVPPWHLPGMCSISQEKSGQGEVEQRSGERRRDQTHWKKAGCSKGNSGWTHDPRE